MKADAPYIDECNLRYNSGPQLKITMVSHIAGEPANRTAEFQYPLTANHVKGGGLDTLDAINKAILQTLQATATQRSL